MTIQQLAHKLNTGQNSLQKLISRAHYLYWEKLILKPDGKIRKLSIPQQQLKLIQEQILKKILNQYRPLGCVHGGITGRSIKTNATPHINKQFVVNIDIKNFFSSIRISMIKKGLVQAGFNNDLIEILIRLTTHNHCLPQGAPTSPFISNLVLIKVDQNIQNFCYQNHLSYTRYFDDITISGKQAYKFVDKIKRIIEQAGFEINKNKLHIQDSKNPQLVTGLVVNKKLSLPEKSVENIRQKIRLLNKKIPIIETDFQKEIAVISGEIAFLNQIDPNLGKKIKAEFLKCKILF